MQQRSDGDDGAQAHCLGEEHPQHVHLQQEKVPSGNSPQLWVCALVFACWVKKRPLRKMQTHGQRDKDGAGTWVHADGGLLQLAVFDGSVESSEEEASVSVGHNGAAGFLLEAVHDHFTLSGTKVCSQTDVDRLRRRQRVQDEEGRLEDQRVCPGGWRLVWSFHHQSNLHQASIISLQLRSTPGWIVFNISFFFSKLQKWQRSSALHDSNCFYTLMI